MFLYQSADFFFLTCSPFYAQVYKTFGVFDAWSNATNKYRAYVFSCCDFLYNIFSLFFSIQCCNAKQFNTIFHVMKFDLLQSNSLFKVLWNDLLFHCSVTLFFNSVHAQCCNVDRNFSVCFLLFVFRDLSQ